MLEIESRKTRQCSGLKTEKHAADVSGIWCKRLLPVMVCLVLSHAPFVLADDNGNVKVIDSDVTGDVYGGQVRDGSTLNNTVTVNATVNGDVYGGSLHNGGDAGYNTVTVSSGAEVTGFVRGGYVELRALDDGGAYGNRVTVDGGKVGQYVIGGFARNDPATGNYVTISGNADIGYKAPATPPSTNPDDESGFVRGGASYNSASNDNHVTITGNARVAKFVVGGDSVIAGDSVNNTVLIDGAGVDIGEYVAGGSTRNGLVENNYVTLRSGTIGGDVTGGYVESDGNAQYNHVTLSGGNVKGQVQGGFTEKNDAVSNVVTIDGGTVDLYVAGGRSNSGNALDNEVVVRSGQVTQYVVGGYTERNGDANGNRVTVTGNAAVTGEIIGGYSGGVGTATNNTVTLTPDAGVNYATSIVYGGKSNGGDVQTGNVLNVTSSHLEVENIANFQTVNLDFNATTAPVSGNAVLELKDAAGSGSNLNGTTVNAVGLIAGGQTVQPVAERITLIENTGGNGIVSDEKTVSGKVVVRQGISLDHNYTVQNTGNAIEALLNNTTVDPATGIFTNGRLATVGFLNEGTDFALDVGMMNALETIRVKGMGVYGAIRGSDVRHDLDKRGDANVSGTHWLLGVAGKLNPAKEYDIVGSVYAEAGWGNIDSDNSFASGHGDTHYYGIGIIGRYQQNEGTMKGAYAQINAKVGRASTDFESNLYDVNGNRGEYDEDSTYYGAGVGVGYLWEIASAYQLDLSARYQWLHLDGYSANIVNDPYHFDDIDSHRTKVGARLNYTENKQYIPYIGVAWEHEFSGTADGSVYGYSLDDNSLKGDTGVGEIGVTFSPSADSAWRVDANVQGYVGQREGVAGHLVLNYLF